MVNLSRFLVQAALAGVAVAVIVAVFFPGLLDPDRNGPAAVLQVPGVPAHGPVSYATGVARAAPAVVNIMTSRTVEFPGPLTGDLGPREHPFEGHPEGREQASLGSGVIVSPTGHILTNHHVIEKAEAIAVVLADGSAHPAEIIGIDPDTDLAVLRIAAGELTAASIGRSNDLAVGDVVLAIGNPFGVGQTVTQGIVSATGRTELGINLFEDFIQTDAAINPGNSGGALINATGELIGISTAIFTRSGGSHGIGFAIPVDLALDVMNEIIEKGYVARGWLGIEVQALDRALAESFGLSNTRGVLIAGILSQGPAARAGLRPGDVIVRLDGQQVLTTREALNIIARKRPGDSLEIEARRDGEALHLEATVDQRPV
ncbi:trypsin-like serine protease [Thioalkalivibrio nitratireducens DSM 14787]|uniref:Trypsin-like serine protease n=1 Tax=Thioalkalivibrio nitratireducens (strain DSM 14787 / UNIQEM 213 / ALEN2) TaxID=1255043 RepID=L0DZ71_THIND|nr:trypsin-like peptidase domain-containing protein [Thioalkalivibrio nitratireducens]AGA34265.1 trypsin-like serine protease [Thioalkalivibrio nitratireducens DSM 14787]